MPEGMRGRRFLRHLALEGPKRYLDASTLFHADEMQQLFKSDAFEQMSRHDPWTDRLSYLRECKDWMSAAQYCDLNTYLPLDILTKVDRMTMAHSIEARPPLLDHRLVEFAAKVPARFRLRETTTKYLLKRVLKKLVPMENLNRPKMGFGVPIGHWFRNQMKRFLGETLLSERALKRGFFKSAEVKRMFELHTRGQQDYAHQLWTLLMLELWFERFID